MKNFPFISPSRAITILRIAVGLMLLAHGVIRCYAGTVEGFGGFLSSKGFPAGVALAWVLTVFEIVGGLTMAAGYFVKWIATIFIVELLMGIFLVHLANGWFVVGYQSGGVEYSVLLILVLVALAAHDRKK